MKFIKGNKYLCLSTYVIKDGSAMYIKGEVYECVCDNKLNSKLFESQNMEGEESNFKLLEIEEPTPEYYNNKNGSIYALQVTRNWNSYTFDIVKRLDRAEHKGEFLSDIDKCIKTLELYKKEQGHRFEGQFEILNK